MKKIWLLFFLFTLSACGIDVMDIQVPEKSPQLVIEGLITNMEGPYSLRLSLSQSITSKDSVRIIPEAEISIFDNLGNLATIHFDKKNKNFLIEQINGMPGRIYFLQINYNGKSYTAKSQMPQEVKTDNPVYEYMEETVTRAGGYYISFPNFDPDRTEAYYQWKVKINEKPLSIEGLDDFIFAKEADNPLGTFTLPFSFNKGDTVEIQTVSLTKEAYHYYNSLLNIVYNDIGLNHAVSNPPTNLKGDALGFFQTSSIISHTVIIQD